MSPIVIATVSVIAIVALMIAVKILIGRMLHNEDKARAGQQDMGGKSDD